MESGADGLLYGGGRALLGIQPVSVVTAAAFAGVMTVAIFQGLKFVMDVRAKETDEARRMDLRAHGETAYKYASIPPAPVGGEDGVLKSA